MSILDRIYRARARVFRETGKPPKRITVGRHADRSVRQALDPLTRYTVANMGERGELTELFGMRYRRDDTILPNTWTLDDGRQ